MMKRLVLFLILIFLPQISLSAEGDYRRVVTLEWEVIPGAKTYDVEIRQKKPINGKSEIFKVTNAQWSGELKPGTYTLRVRGKDKRRVPGDWSAEQEFPVNVEPIVPLAPANKNLVQSVSHDEYNVTFSWKKLNGINQYNFEIESEDGKIKKKEKAEGDSIVLSLPVAQKYIWKVSHIGFEGFITEAPVSFQFTLLGKKLEKPQISPPKSEFVRTISWTKPTYTENIDYLLTRWDKRQKKWFTVKANKSINETAIEFSDSWIGGRYRLLVRGNANLRTSSDQSELTFSVIEGKRTQSAEAKATLRQSIDRTSGWFGIASYLVTGIEYKSTPSDSNYGVSFPTAFGGTGRLGAGYLSPIYPWGFLSILDYSGFLMETSDGTSNVTYGTMEANSIYRVQSGERGEMRSQFGLFYKETPEIYCTDMITGHCSVNKVSALGPHYGFEYWFALSSKMGFQANTHLYLSTQKITTPNGGEIAPTLSMQLGFLGSYRLSKKSTGLMGYAYRDDNLSYKTINATSKEQDYNKVSVKGHYFNLYLEWSL